LKEREREREKGRESAARERDMHTDTHAQDLCNRYERHNIQVLRAVALV
jgi:hypothetical protein